MKSRRVSLMVAVFLAIWVGSAHGFPWSRDMKDQPSIKSQEAPRRPPAGTIPRDGWERPMTREEMGKSLTNPVPFTRQSVDNGKRLFEIYCALCHGANGKGMGPVAIKFIPPPDLTLPFFQQKADGFIYGTIRNGGAIMPAYGAVLAPKERWEIVNFLRSLQRQ
ncbi:MAG: cytochrome c [candidate division NC10 bacterium]|nr:cytochrome c [candidate division NC10 bacterium]